MHGSSRVLARGLDDLRAAVLAVLENGPGLSGVGGFGPAGPALAGAGGPVPAGALLSLGNADAARGSLGTASGGAATGVTDRTVTGGASRDVISAVSRAQRGDADAFGELYDTYLSTVYRYVLYRVGSSALAEDLTSETFLRALRRIGSFTWQGRDFGAWLVTIARNLVTDHFKSGRFRLEVTTAEMLDADRVEDGPEDSVVASITNVALFDAVKRLSPEQQECIVLRFLQGMSVAETAQIMGKNDGAVKTLQYRAVRSLARIVPQDLR
ncbi:MAG: ECF subfamily RNA polymerase sigma factor, BldN family [Actinomycetes bacterium]